MKKYVISIGIILVVVTIVIVILMNTTKPMPAVAPALKTYVAMGDSVAAGIGLEDNSDSSACDRTNQSYPNVVANSINYSLKNFACNRATIPAGITGAQEVNNLIVAPQIKQLFDLPKPNLVTITIGANDAKWTTVIAKCYASTCGSPSDKAEVTTNLTTTAATLRTLLGQIQDHYNLAIPRVIVTGYHQVFPAASVSTCTDLVGIDASELSWLRQLQAALNDTIRGAVDGYLFATFVPVDFSGHELCTSDPWVQGLNGKQPYHPTDAGQGQFAKQIIAIVK